METRTFGRLSGTGPPGEIGHELFVTVYIM
jgi:hypothetical protein